MLLKLLLHFNSIKVRLKLDICCDQVKFDKFQFHKGTIKTGNITSYWKASTKISIP